MQGATLRQALASARNRCLRRTFERWNAGAWTWLGDAGDRLEVRSGIRDRPTRLAGESVVTSKAEQRAHRGGNS